MQTRENYLNYPNYLNHPKCPKSTPNKNTRTTGAMVHYCSFTSSLEKGRKLSAAGMRAGVVSEERSKGGAREYSADTSP